MIKYSIVKDKYLFKNLNNIDFNINLPNNILNFNFTNNNIEDSIYSFLNPEVLKYKNTILELKDDYIRCKADLENFKKRSNDELSKAYKYAIEDFSENLLFVLDSLESALNDKFNNTEKLLEGVRLTLKLLTNILEKNKINNILPKKGDIFDPHKHLAISTLNFNDLNNNTVINVLQKGYSIFERVLRPALVVVNKVD